MWLSSAFSAPTLLILLQVLSTASSPVSDYRSSTSGPINREQRCNFIEDSSDGEDERACGACQFEGSDPQQECGLELWADESLDWSWFELPADLLAQATRQRVAVRGALELSTAATYETARSNNYSHVAHLTRRAGIHFPYYRPTDAKNCKFSYTSRPVARENQHVQQNHQQTIIKTILVVARDRNKLNLHNDLAKLHLLDTFTVHHAPGELARAPNERSIAINAAQMPNSTWTIAMLVENHANASSTNGLTLLELADFKFSGCEPSEVYLNNPPPSQSIVDLEQVMQKKCLNENMFMCKLSGRCISEDYRCDFGQDCGPFDFSDEHNCSRDLYQGRCDFEHGPEWCNWFDSPVRGNSWLWTTSDSATSQKLVKHETIDANHTQGHFMLANMDYRRTLPHAQIELLGPRVYLRKGHKMCYFRLWAGTTRNYTEGYHGEWLEVFMDKRLVESLYPYHYEKLSWQQLTFAEESKPNWNRFQVLLINGSDISEAYSFDRLRLFTEQRRTRAIPEHAFLALDDFSFSPGCGLAHHEQLPLASVCPPDQFVCTLTRADKPDQVCLPANRVCDFMDDCGRDPLTGVASDEALCKSRFDFTRDNFNTSGLHLNDYGRLTDDSKQPWRADAFRVELPVEKQVDGALYEPLRIVAQQWTFSNSFNTTAGHAYSTESGLLLPRFNQAHANCSLRIFYKWVDPDDLSLNVYLVRGATKRLVLRHHRQYRGEDRMQEVRPHGESLSFGNDLESMELGIGQQDRPFNIHLEIAAGHRYRGDGKYDLPFGNYRGEFQLFAYQFTGCSFPPSHLAPPPRLAMHDLEDLSNGDEDEYQYSLSGPPANLTCPAGHFQCGQPVLCLPERLVCDMQRDCQESNADELDCAARGYFQLDFQSDLDELETERGLVFSYSHGGNSSSNEKVPWRWDTRTSWGLELRNDRGVGPAFDHTRRNSRSRFLTFAYQGDLFYILANLLINTPHEATFSMGQFKVTNSCQRLVIYVHVWPEPATRTPGKSLSGIDTSVSSPSASLKSLDWDIRIHYLSPKGSSNQHVRAANSTWTYPKLNLDSARDGWQRIEWQLPHTNSSLCANCSQATHFNISFWSTITFWPGMKRPIVAFDDLVLGPKCELIGNAAPLVKLPAAVATVPKESETASVGNVSLTTVASTEGKPEMVVKVHDRSRSSVKWFLGTFVLACGILAVAYSLIVTYRSKQARKIIGNIGYQDVPLESHENQML